MKFITENFYLRLIEKDDAQVLLDFELRNRELFTLTSPTRPDSFYTLEGKQQFIDRLLIDAENNLGYSFLLFNHQNECVGWVSLFEILNAPSLNSCFIGYRTDPSIHHKGYTTQAVSMVCDFAFNSLKIHRIEAGVLPRNIASQRVLEKNGFEREGLSRKNVEINGVWEDHYLYGQLNPNTL